MGFSTKACAVISIILLPFMNAYALDNKSVFDIAANGTIAEIRKSLETGSNINILDAKGYTPVMHAILHDNYEVFEYLVKHGSDITLATNNGCNVQILLGYFSLNNFEKSCALLVEQGFSLDKPTDNNMSLLHYLVFSCDYDKVKFLLQYKPDLYRKEIVSDSLPIDMLQYCDYQYTNINSLSEGKKKNISKIRELLIANGSPDITFLPLTIGRFGNFFFSNFKIINQIKPSISVDQINLSKYYTFYRNGKQETARLDLEKLYEMYANVGLKIEISVYDDNFQDIIKKCAESPDPYFLIANMGNCPLISQNWVNISGLEDNKYFLIKNDSDIRFQVFDYRLQDINFLMTIRLLQ